MSKAQKEKVIVNYEEVPLLADLEFPALVKEFHRLHLKEDKAAKEVETINKDRKSVGVSIQAAIEAVKVDSVDLQAGKLVLRATLVKGEPSEKLDEDKLKLNLMKTAKLDAGTIAKIFAASQVPVEARKPYVLVTAQE